MTREYLLTDTMSELALLNALLTWRNEIHEAVGIIGNTGECFSDPKNGTLYEAMISLLQEGKSHNDINNLKLKLGEEDFREVIRVVQSENFAAYTRDYANNVLASYQRRQMWELGNKLRLEAECCRDPASDIIHRATKACATLSEGSGEGVLRSAAEGVEAAVALAERMAQSNGRLTGIPSGIGRLDGLTGGWQNQELIVFAARPSVGKTALACAAILGACRDNIPTMFFSAEMSVEKIFMRLLSAQGEARMDRLKEGFLARQTVGKLRMAAECVSRFKLHVDDTPNIRISQIQAQARKWHRKHGPGLIVVDYLQILNDSERRNEKRHVVIGEWTRMLKHLARDLNVPVIVLSQINRDGDVNSKPKLSQLKESGSIEQDADLVVLLAQASDSDRKRIQEAKNFSDDILDQLLYLDLAKNRNGPTGIMWLYYEKATQIISDSPVFLQNEQPTMQPVDDWEETDETEEELF